MKLLILLMTVWNAIAFVMMGIDTVSYTHLFIAYAFSQTNQMGTGPQQQMKMMTTMMKYVFPIMILMMARSYPAGLAIYWSGSQIIQIFYNIRFARLKKKMREEAKKKTKKKRPAKA